MERARQRKQRFEAEVSREVLDRFQELRGSQDAKVGRDRRDYHKSKGA